MFSNFNQSSAIFHQAFDLIDSPGHCSAPTAPRVCKMTLRHNFSPFRHWFDFKFDNFRKSLRVRITTVCFWLRWGYDVMILFCIHSVDGRGARQLDRQLLNANPSVIIVINFLWTESISPNGSCDPSTYFPRQQYVKCFVVISNTFCYFFSSKYVKHNARHLDFQIWFYWMIGFAVRFEFKLSTCQFRSW